MNLQQLQSAPFVLSKTPKREGIPYLEALFLRHQSEHTIICRQTIDTIIFGIFPKLTVFRRCSHVSSPHPLNQCCQVIICNGYVRGMMEHDEGTLSATKQNNQH